MATSVLNLEVLSGGKCDSGTFDFDSTGEKTITLGFEPKHICVTSDYTQAGSSYCQFVIWDVANGTYYISALGNQGTTYVELGQTSQGFSLVKTSTGFTIGRGDNGKTMHWFALG